MRHARHVGGRYQRRRRSRLQRLRSSRGAAAGVNGRLARKRLGSDPHGLASVRWWNAPRSSSERAALRGATRDRRPARRMSLTGRAPGASASGERVPPYHPGDRATERCTAGARRGLGCLCGQQAFARSGRSARDASSEAPRAARHPKQRPARGRAKVGDAQRVETSPRARTRANSPQLVPVHRSCCRGRQYAFGPREARNRHRSSRKLGRCARCP